jgi:predicted nucleic acid-binding protein
MARKDRIPVVFDTSLSITRFLPHKKNYDNMFLDTAYAGKAKLLISRDQSCIL